MAHKLDLRARELAVAQHGVFRDDQLEPELLTRAARRHRLESGAWRSVYPGVYELGGVPSSWQGSVLAGCWTAGRLAVASHRTAAALWGLPGKASAPIEVTCPRGARCRRTELVVHESVEVVEQPPNVDGIPVTPVARTLLDLGAVAGEVTVEMAVDVALRRNLVTLADLEAVLATLGRRGRNGVAALRAVLDRRGARAPTESEMETLLLAVIRAHGLPTPTVQFVVRGEGGAFVARVDAAYPDARVALEYDSYEHHVGRVPLVRDSARRNHLIALGWMVITATAVDLQQGGDSLCRAIRVALGRPQCSPSTFWRQ